MQSTNAKEVTNMARTQHSHPTSRPAWAAGAPRTGRRPRSAGSRSSSSPSASAACVGTKNIDPNTSGPGQSGRMDRILDAGFKQPAGESVLIQSRSLRPSNPAFKAAVADVVARDLRARPSSSTSGRRSLRQRGPDREGRARRARRVRDPRRPGQGRRQGRPGRSTASTTAQQAHPRLFIGEFGDASAVSAVDDAVRQRPRRRPGCSRSRSRW